MLFINVIYSGERPYKCHECDTAFSQNVDPCMHMRIHSGEKLHKGNPCKNAYAGKCDVTNNIRIHSGDKLIECLKLDKDFVHNDIISIHTLIRHCRKKYKWKIIIL